MVSNTPKLFDENTSDTLKTILKFKGKNPAEFLVVNDIGRLGVQILSKDSLVLAPKVIDNVVKILDTVKISVFVKFRDEVYEPFPLEEQLFKDKVRRQKEIKKFVQLFVSRLQDIACSYSRLCNQNECKVEMDAIKKLVHFSAIEIDVCEKVIKGFLGNREMPKEDIPIVGDDGDDFLEDISGIPSSENGALARPATNLIGEIGHTAAKMAQTALDVSFTLLGGECFRYVASDDGNILNSQKRLANLGFMLNSVCISSFLAKLSPRQKPLFNTIHNYYLYDNSAVNICKFDNIKNEIDVEFSCFKTKDLPVCIPITFKNDRYIEMQHVAVIIIRDNIVEYFDPSGKTSDMRKLADTSSSKTMKDVLDFCQKKFTNQENEIIENKSEYQFDVANCGVFAANHIYSRLVQKTPMGSFQTSAMSREQIIAFRKYIHDTIYPDLKTLT